MKRLVVIVLTLLSTLLSTTSFKLPLRPAFPSSGLLHKEKSLVFPHNSLQRTQQVYRGGAFFSSSDEEEDDMFDQLETMNEFASFQQDIYSAPSSNKNLFKQNQRKIGIALMTTGILFTILGMVLFFEGNLLRLGNLSFLLGTSLLVGPLRISQFFLQPARLRATVSLALGIFLVLIKWSKLGILCEIFGFFNLFGNMFPLLYRLLRSLPGVGDVLSAFEGKSDDIYSPYRQKKSKYESSFYE